LKNITLLLFAAACLQLHAQRTPDPCPRPAEGITIVEPEDLRSKNGELKVDLDIENARQSDGSIRYCYIDQNGKPSPNLRVNPGDLVILKLKNNLKELDAPTATPAHTHASPAKSPATSADPTSDPCTRGLMTPHPPISIFMV